MYAAHKNEFAMWLFYHPYLADDILIDSGETIPITTDLTLLEMSAREMSKKSLVPNQLASFCLSLLSSTPFSCRRSQTIASSLTLLHKYPTHMGGSNPLINCQYY